MASKTRTEELFLDNTAAAFLIQDKSVVRNMRETDTLVLSVIWPSGTSAGTIVLETAPDAGYTGTWLTLGTIAVGSDAGKFIKTANLDAVVEFVRARWTVAPVDMASKPRVFLHYRQNQS